MTNRQDILKRWRLLRPYLDGRQRNLWAAAEAAVIGQGGCTSLADITGLSSTTIFASVARRMVPLPIEE